MATLRNKLEKLCEEKINIISDKKIEEAGKYKKDIDTFLDNIPIRIDKLIKPKLKEKKSLSRKLLPICISILNKNNQTNKNEEDLYITWDILRYTVICKFENFQEIVNSYIEYIHNNSKNYKLSWIYNTFCKPNIYSGLNVNFKVSNTNFQFEIQFHTEETFKYKQESHKTYESTRINENQACIKLDEITKNKDLKIPTYNLNTLNIDNIGNKNCNDVSDEKLIELQNECHDEAIVNDVESNKTESNKSDDNIKEDKSTTETSFGGYRKKKTRRKLKRSKKKVNKSKLSKKRKFKK
tara:strand:- start:98 stop:985 length:888 start_codon:yes stop_codon:yes gene_type:complete